jgi:hypothetical protein
MFNSIFQVVDEIGTIEELRMKTLNQVKTVKVVSSKWEKNGIWLPVKALRRLIPWLPVGAVVQVINKSHSDGMDMAHDVVWNSFFYFCPTLIYIKFSF